MNIPVIIKSSTNAGIPVKALVDSGAQGKFIDRFLVRRLGLSERPLAHPIPVYNVDGTPNRIGSIRNYVEPDMVINGKPMKERLFVTHLGKQEMILGFDWLQKYNPRINWKRGVLDFTPRVVLIDDEADPEERIIQAATAEEEALLRDHILVERNGGDLPTRGSTEAAGLNITAATTATIPPRSRTRIPTGLKVTPPPGTYVRIAPRSGLASKGIDVAAGVVDRDYTGEIQVILVNNTDTTFQVNRGDRIAQLITEKIAYPVVQEVPSLKPTSRGESGFGSTGLNSKFRQLLSLTVGAIRLATHPECPLQFRIASMECVNVEEQATDADYVLAYTPGTQEVRTLSVHTTVAATIQELLINAKINPAMALAQEEGTQSKAAPIPEYLSNYTGVFEKKAAERFPDERPYDHAIDLKPDFVPRDCKIYPLSPVEEKSMNEFIDENLRKGYIRPSKSPMASPFFFVGKKDGNLRPCQDYRYLNEGTVKNAYPLPLISDLLDKVKGFRRFTKMDLRSGYNNVRIKDGDQWKAAFKTSRGLFEPTVMFFGLCNSPATFQAMMNDIFKDMLGEGWLQIYMDDLLICGDNDDDMQAKTLRVVERLRDNDLFVKPEKCVFNTDTVEFLGMIISHNNVSMDPVKVKGVLEWPTPTTVKQVRGFLGFGNFYRRFIDHYSDIVRPLTELTRKDVPFAWTPACQAAFDELKRRFTTAPVLLTPDTTKPFVLECDASLVATAAVLRQQDVNGEWHPVAYLSQTLLPAERNYEIYDRELLAIVRALETWRHYLHGAHHPIRILTDHKNLTYFRSARRLNRRQARWHLFLSQFDYTLHHCPGTQLVQADTLTRNRLPTHTADDNVDIILLPDTVFHPARIRSLHIATDLLSINDSTVPDTPLPFDESLRRDIRRHTMNDTFATTVRAALADPAMPFPGRMTRDDWHTEDGLLFHHDKCYVPSDLALRRQIVQLYHDSPVTGHPGRFKTAELVDRDFY
ncbi:polyprotein, partial [Phanerochaete sordida]